MDSQLAIHTIRESCYRVGYPTYDHYAEYKRRMLINQSCDYAINCIEKIEKIEQIINDYDTNCGLEEYMYLEQIKEVLE